MSHGELTLSGVASIAWFDHSHHIRHRFLCFEGKGYSNVLKRGRLVRRLIVNVKLFTIFSFIYLDNKWLLADVIEGLNCPKKVKEFEDYL
jgi:hypothetical protein